MSAAPILQTIRLTTKQIVEQSLKSAMLADKISIRFCKEYIQLNNNEQTKNEKYNFLKLLCKEHGLKSDQLYSNIKKLADSNPTQIDFEKNFKSKILDDLNRDLKPAYFNLFNSLARVNDGISILVQLRQDVLGLLKENKTKKEIEPAENDLKIMNLVLKDLLKLWFSTGLLSIQTVNWNSPTSLIEKVWQYEGVHKMKTMSELKKRLAANRRCFVYIHPSMSLDPIAILHCALTNEVSSNVQEIINNASLSDGSKTNSEYTNAIFYSVNSCHKGLMQIDLGNALIKNGVDLLIKEMPNLKHFHTLSPIPGFKNWLDSQFKHLSVESGFDIQRAFSKDEKKFLYEFFKLDSNQVEVFQEKFKDFLNSVELRSNLTKLINSTDNEVLNTEMIKQAAKIVGDFLVRSCAYYLYHEKKNQFSINSVCNFHLRNGAKIYRINLNGDLSENGWKSSYGLMINYEYELNEVNINCIDYLTNKNIKVSNSVEKLLINLKSN